MHISKINSEKKKSSLISLIGGPIREIILTILEMRIAVSFVYVTCEVSQNTERLPQKCNWKR